MQLTLNYVMLIKIMFTSGSTIIGPYFHDKQVVHLVPALSKMHF